MTMSKQIYILAHHAKYIPVENKSASHKQYLLGLLFPRNVKKTHNGPKCTTIFTISEKKGLKKLQK